MVYNPFASIINSLLPEPQAALANGIIFGVKAQIPRDLYTALIDTGTIHIVVLSGMNISILISLIAKITLFLGRKISSLLTICLIALFVWFVGGQPPIIRAAIMGSFSLLAINFGKQYWGLLSLVLASLIMLLYDFSLVKNISFQLSLLATFGILLTQGREESQSKRGLIGQLIYLVRENLRLTLSAQIMTLPVILYNFQRVSIIAPIANLAIQWVIQPIMILGLVTSIIGWVWRPLGIIPAWFTYVPLTYLIAVVEWLAKVPYASVNF